MRAQSSVSVICPALIGRVQALEGLRSSIDRVQSAQGSSVLISGEAGIGKSRLVAEAVAHATGLGLVIFHGNCFQPDISCPYAPLLDLFRSYFADVTLDLAAELKPFAHAFKQLLPDLVPLTPDLMPQLAPEQEKRRLFALLAQFFVSRVAQRPALIIIEDLHWSDDTSLEFMQYLARRCSGQPLLLIMTYRNDELRPSLRHFLAELDRERLAQEISLTRLTRSEVEAMLRTIFALENAVRGDFLDAINELTEGNPFFVEEILKSLITAGEIYYSGGSWDRKAINELHIPRSIQDAVQQRFIQLSATAQHTVRLAAVAGRRFDFTLLQSLVSSDEEQLLSAVKELIAAQLVIEESTDQFAFRHALTRQTIYGDLLARERKALHQVIGTTIERIYAASLDAHVADLAYHAFEGEDWSKALKYAAKAGDRALALYAPYAAIEHFTHALHAAESLPDISPIPLYHDRGQAYELLGAFEPARLDYEQVLERARVEHDGPTEWESLVRLGFLWTGHDYKHAGTFFQRALDVAETLNDPKLRAHSLNRLGNWLVNVGQAVEGLQAHHAALQLFQVQDDPRGVAETLDLLAMASGIYGDIPSTIGYYEQAIARFRELDDPKVLTSILASRTSFSNPYMCDVFLSPLRTLEAVQLDADEALSLARKMGSLADESYAEWTAGTAYMGFGELGRGLRHAQRGLTIATEIEHRQWTAGAYFTLGQIYLAMLVSELAIQRLEAGLRLAQEVGSAWWTGNITAYLALAYLQAGDADRAETLLKAELQIEALPGNAPERRLLWAWGELALVQGYTDVALDIANRLIASVPGGPSSQPIPILLKLRGQALMRLQRMEEAQHALEEAQHGALERGARPLLWQVHVALGQLYQASKNDEQAHAAYSQAHSIVESLAQTIDDVALREAFLYAALETMPKQKSLPARRADAEKFDGLTARERQIAVEIAHGKSNREIADLLFLSERTVETHVRNVLSKLSFTSRAQIAAWAVQKDLTGSGAK